MSWWDDHELDKSCLRLTLVFDSCKTKQIDLVCDHRIMTLDSNQNLIVFLLRRLFNHDRIPDILRHFTWFVWHVCWSGCILRAGSIFLHQILQISLLCLVGHFTYFFSSFFINSSWHISDFLALADLITPSKPLCILRLQRDRQLPAVMSGAHVSIIQISTWYASGVLHVSHI